MDNFVSSGTVVFNYLFRSVNIIVVEVVNGI
jgi:hypothetical protein